MKPHRLAAIVIGCVLTAAPLDAQLNDIPNSVKYRDTSLPNATGRAGNATIEAQALLGKDGMTELTVTSNGSIEKVQLKLGEAARNFNGLSGNVFARQLEGLGRLAPMQVQANVSGVDGNRTGVVTVTESVKLRPDLAIESLNVQPHAAIGVPLHVHALLRERNGDVGARANCVLYANGVEVDRANGLWIDRSGTVSCRLMHAFENAGPQELQVALTDVAPGDYDSANNTASASVKVYATVTELPQWWASGEERNWVETRKGRSFWQEVDAHDKGWSKFTSFSANVENYTGSRHALRISYQEVHDGETVVDIADAPWSEVFRNCTVTNVDGTNIEKCVIPPGRRGPTVPILQIHVSRGGGEVTYRSRGWYQSYNSGTGQYDRYSLDWDHVSTYGDGNIELGNTIQMTVRASDGTTMFEATPFINMAPTESHHETPYSCTTDWTGNPNCFGWTYDSYGRYGSDSHNM